MKVRPKKHLGQHFLTDARIAQKTADALPDKISGALLEIGPGTGMLTQFLTEKNEAFYPVEIDPESAEYLREAFPELDDRILEGDFLELNLQEKFPQGLAVIGNFPYNISAPILFKVLENKTVVHTLAGMFQKEVAQRAAAVHGNKTYGILSVLLQTFYRVEYLFSVGPEKFNPPPKVDSGVIRLQKIPDKYLACDEKFFFRVVKTAFGQRRKMLRNSLKSFFKNSVPSHPFMTQRPEQLSPQEFEELTAWIEAIENTN